MRRVAINFDWFGVALKKIRGKSEQKESTTTARLDALRKNKDLLEEELQRRRTSVRFEPTQSSVDTESNERSVTFSDDEQTIANGKSNSISPEPEGPSYTERLLAAKRKARKD